MKPKYLILTGVVLLLAVVLAACQGQTTAPAVEEQPCPTAAPCPECPTCPEPPAPPEPVVKEVPFQDLWANSAHNDAEAEAFNHWNEDDPAEVPTACATCHSTAGYQDFLGADGTEPGVDNAVPAPAGTIQCVACHNSVAATLSSVTFPSGVEVSGLDASARCMVCHQGRASKASVDEQLEKFGVTEDLDTVPEPVEDSTLGFINIHYFAAASTLYGTQTQGGYEYAGKSYDFKNDHVEGYNSCIGCHNPHTLELKTDECFVCHQGVEDVRDIRMQGSEVDYDGDGDMEEGIAYEIDGLREMLYQAIQAYASEVAGAPIVYDAHSYPYFFNDTNANGEVDEGEAAYPNKYANWTARLLKAAYNYQVSTKDPGAFAHGGKYIIQLVYDSIEDLNQALSTPVDLSAAHRIDHGHFAGSQEAFRHWDEDGEVSASCSKCHSATGLVTFLKEGVTISEPLANGLNCATCHDNLAEFTRRTVDSVTFPSGASLTFGEANDNNLCINCHQGRESKSSVDAAIGELGDDEVGERLSFRNPHYFAAGATLFGADAGGAYMYAGKEYNGRNLHVAGFDNCLACHNAHALEVKYEACGQCHPTVKSAADLESIRISTVDFDGDGDASEGIAGELETMAELLYQAIQDYAAAQGLPGIVYDAHAYPYFFLDNNGNGMADPDEANFGNRYNSWTPRLLRAAYNYQWFMKDPGAFAHNGQFMLQVLYDSLQDMGVNVSAMTRPEVKAGE